jgi:heme oxygenase
MMRARCVVGERSHAPFVSCHPVPAPSCGLQFLFLLLLRSHHSASTHTIHLLIILLQLPRVDKTLLTFTFTTTMTSFTAPSTCPYAAALKGQHKQQLGLILSDDSESEGETLSLPDQQLVELERARQKCPAFTNNNNSNNSKSTASCPFSKAKTSQQVKETLLQLPPSHLDPNGVFYKSLEQLHKTAGTTGNTTTGNTSGKCPVKNSVPERVAQHVSFHQAMEDYSLAAIMARMAQEKEQHGLAQVIVMTPRETKRTATTTPVVPKNTTTATTTPTTTTAAAIMPTTTTPTLSEALKSGTAASHTQAEDVHFVKNFIRGIIDRELYAQLVGDLLHVYTHLEVALDLYAPTYFETVHFPKQLGRTQALKEDVDFWLGSSSTTIDNHTTTMPPISQATQDYLDRIQHCCQTNPLLLLAHAYTRYLGDLSGGKILARVARRALNLQPSDDGLAFYEFEHVKSAKVFKDDYRKALNLLNLTQVQIHQLVQEANIAFGLNMRIFEELDVAGGVLGATVRPLQDILQFEHQAVVLDKTAECPFKYTSSNTNNTTTTTKKSGTCPWPFILLHDPSAGMQCWQTWLVIGLVSMCLYHYFMAAAAAAMLYQQ